MAETEAQILHYKKYLTKYFETPKEDKIVYMFQKLDKLGVTLELLQSTGIGKTVNSFRKHEAGVGEKARALVAKWKQLVSGPAPEVPAETARSSTPGLQCETVSETTYGSDSGRVQHRLDKVMKTPYLDGGAQPSPDQLPPITGVKVEVKSEQKEDKTLKAVDSKHTKHRSHGDSNHNKNLSHSSDRENRKKEGDRPKRESDRDKIGKRERGEDPSHSHSKRKKTEDHHRSGGSVRQESASEQNVSLEKVIEKVMVEKVVGEVGEKNEDIVNLKDDKLIIQKKVKKEKTDSLNENSNEERRKEGSQKHGSSKSDQTTKEDVGKKEKHRRSKSSHHRSSREITSTDEVKVTPRGSSPGEGEARVKSEPLTDTKEVTLSDFKVQVKEEKIEATDKIRKDEKHSKKSTTSEGHKPEKVHSSKEKQSSSGHSKRHDSDKHRKHGSKSKNSSSSNSKSKGSASSEHSSSSKEKSKKSSSQKTKEAKKTLQEFDMFTVTNTLSDEDADAEITNGASMGDSLADRASPPNKKVKIEASTSKGNYTQNRTSSKLKSSSSSASPLLSCKNGDKNDATTKSSLSPLVPQPMSQLDVSQDDILSPLPETTPNYKPLPYLDLDLLNRKTDTAADQEVGYKKNTRTQVYSGRRNIFLSTVPSLFDACIQVLRENIDALDYVGGVPFDILKPVLEVCNPSQLYTIEDANPQFIGETDALWEAHCKKDFRKAQPTEFESWRELYIRMHDARDAKLKSLTASITASMAKAMPVRTTKLAYVDTVAKAPRDVRRRQRIHGTAGPQGKSDPLSKLSSHSTGVRQPRVPIPRASDPNISTSLGRPRSDKPIKIIAPMMRKTLRFMKGLQRI